MIQIATGAVKLLRKRNIELTLLVAVIFIGNCAVALVQLGALDELRPDPFVSLQGLYLAAIVLHGIMRFYAPNAESFIMPVALLLNSLGIAEIYHIDLQTNSSQSSRQILWSILSIAAVAVTIITLKNYRSLQRYTYLLGLLSLLLLLLPVIPGIGTAINGARVWVRLGPFSFQPGELAKITLALFFAGYLYTHREALTAGERRIIGMKLPLLRNIAPLILVWVLAMAVIVIQRDLGTGVLYFGLFMVLIYTATAKVSWLVFGGVLVGTGAYAAAKILPYVGYRFDIWLNAFDQSVFERSFGGSYQLLQGLFGMAFGGILGTGLGEGYPDVTPLAQSDYIVASLAEELGFTGLIMIMLMYTILFARTMRVAHKTSDDFAKLLAAGLGFVMALQVFIVIGGITRVIPLTGLTAPFLAAGGSSLLVNWLIIALVLRISDNVREPSPVLISTERKADV